MKIKANGISMNYQSKGEGTSLLLIHGAGDNLNMWYHQVPVLSRSYRVITYDIRASGKSEGPKGQYSMPLFADDACELLKALGVANAYVLGYSLGGRIALELALKHPESVKALVLSDSSLVSVPPSPEALRQRQERLELLEKGDIRDIKRDAETMTTNAFSPGFRSKNPAEFERYMKVKLQNSGDGLAKVLGGLYASSASPDLSRVKCPVLLIVGEHDRYVSVEHGKMLQESIAGSKLVVLPGGHAAAIEAPEKFNSAVIEFLSGIRGG